MSEIVRKRPKRSGLGKSRKIGRIHQKRKELEVSYYVKIEMKTIQNTKSHLII